MCTTWIKPIPGVCSYWFSVTKFMVHTWTNDCAWCIPMGAIGWVIHTTKVELWVERDYVYSYPHLEPVGCNAGSRDLGDSCTVPNQPPPLQVYSHKIWLWIQSYGLLLRGCDCWSTMVTSCWQTYAHEIRTLWQTSTAMNIGVSLICCLHGDTCVVAMHYATPLFWRWAGHQQSTRALNCRGRLLVL